MNNTAKVKDFIEKVKEKGNVFQGELSNIDDFDCIISKLFKDNKGDVLFFLTLNQSMKIRDMLSNMDIQGSVGYYKEPLIKLEFLVDYSFYINGISFNCLENYDLETSVIVSPDCKPEKSVLILNK